MGAKVNAFEPVKRSVVQIPCAPCTPFNLKQVLLHVGYTMCIILWHCVSQCASWAEDGQDPMDGPEHWAAD